MDAPEQSAKRAPHAQSTIPVQQKFLFVDAAEAKTSRQGRHDARRFVMQKARRERPWSTSKNAKQRNASNSTSPKSTCTPESTPTPKTTTPSPSIVREGNEHFTGIASSQDARSTGVICPDCQVSLCRSGAASCPRCLIIKPASPTDDIDFSLFDPFQSSSIEMNTSVSELLEHCKFTLADAPQRDKTDRATTHNHGTLSIAFFTSAIWGINWPNTDLPIVVLEMAPGIIAVDVRHSSTLMKSDWFGTAIGNAGFMHSLLCTAALHLYIVGRGSVETILYHRAQAIEAINTAISNPDLHFGIADANIGAVFNLLTVEEGLSLPFFDQERLKEDHPRQRSIHMNGLRRMVQLRGGLTAIKSNRILQAFILWHSTAHAIASFEAPNPSTLDYISTATFPQHQPGYQPEISQHLLAYCQRCGVRETLTQLVESTLVLIADLNAWFDYSDNLLDPLNIQNFSCVLECMLLSWLREHEHLITPLEDALCVALLILTVRTTEALQRKADVHLLHFAASKRLEKALNCTVRSEWQHCPDLLLWILSIGAISAEGSAKCSWFVYQASLACAEFNIQDAETLIARLHACGWVSYKLDNAVRHLWQRIINIRLEPYFEPPSKAEDANSPVGPLQHSVAEQDFMDWENIDWATLSHGLEIADNVHVTRYNFTTSRTSPGRNNQGKCS